ncbi:MAG: synthase subunit [Bacteroidota bacterium]|jgi:F-type H+-transporting ATPase subunit a|nr:ATP synthase F0 subunit A [Chitinophagia bacterium]
MGSKRLKSLLVAILGLFFTVFSLSVKANEEAGEKALDPAKVIMEHIQDAHDFHFFTLKKADGTEFHASIPLPVILYSQTKGLVVFSSSQFHHGHASYQGYQLEENKIHSEDPAEVFYDLSITKNVVQMLIALTLLVVLLIGVANKYKKGQGVTTAPKGWQNAIEPVITFVRDEVAKPNLGGKYAKYLPYLLTVFFFILINNIFGLLPGSANVTGNIAFTVVLGVISFFVILFSTNKHFWAHIFWFPGVPLPVRIFIMLPVELLGVFTKPFALIVRLFANMVAGHIIILSFITLIFIFGSMSAVAGWGFSPLSVAFAVFIYLIEIMVAFIQAFIFTNLTAVFIGQAFEGGHDDHH